MEPKIVEITSKKFVGIPLEMSFVANQTHQLWRKFMPSVKFINNRIGENLYGFQDYNGVLDMLNFDPNVMFTKWACAEVSSYEDVLDGLQSLTITGGKYAVFDYQGSQDTFGATFQYIFWNWLPNSNYLLDNRLHFEVLGKNYKNNDPSSEEEIWIPVIERKN